MLSTSYQYAGKVALIATIWLSPFIVATVFEPELSIQFLSIQVFIACGIGKSGKAGTEEDDPFRKPKPGMWQLMEKHFNSGLTIDMDELVFPLFDSSIDAIFWILKFI